MARRRWDRNGNAAMRVAQSALLLWLSFHPTLTTLAWQTVTAWVLHDVEPFWTIQIRNNTADELRLELQVYNCVEVGLGCGSTSTYLGPRQTISYTVARSACTDPTVPAADWVPCDKRKPTAFAYDYQVAPWRQQGAAAPTTSSASGTDVSYRGVHAEIVRGILGRTSGWSCEPIKPPIIAVAGPLGQRDKHINDAIQQAFGIECYSRRGMEEELRFALDGLIESLAEADALCGSRAINLGADIGGAGVGSSSMAQQVYPCGTNWGARGGASSSSPTGVVPSVPDTRGLPTSSAATASPQVSPSDLAGSVKELVDRRSADREANARVALSEADREIEARAARASENVDTVLEQARYSGPNPDVPPGWQGSLTTFVEVSPDGCSIVATRSTTETDPTGYTTLKSVRSTWTSRLQMSALVNAEVDFQETPQTNLPRAGTIFIRNTAAVVDATLESLNAVRPGTARSYRDSSLFFMIRDSSYGQRIGEQLLSRIQKCGGSVSSTAPTSRPAVAQQPKPPAGSSFGGESAMSSGHKKLWGVISGLAGAAAVLGYPALTTSSKTEEPITLVTGSNRPPSVTCGDIKLNADSDLRATDVGIAAVTTFAFGVAVSDPDGDSIATLIEYGDGTSGSSPLHVYNSAGTFSPSVRVTDSRGESRSCTFLQGRVVVGTVTGNWLGGPTSGNSSSRFTLNQNGTNVDGTYVEDNGLTFPLRSSFVERRGTFSGLRITVSRGGPGDEIVLSLEPSNDARTYSGTFTYRGRSGAFTMRR